MKSRFSGVRPGRESLRAVRQKRKQMTKFVRPRAKRGECIVGLRAEPSDFTTTAGNAMNRGIGELSGVRIFSRSFARVLCCLGRVDQIVDDLKHEARRASIGRESGKFIRVGTRRERAHAARGLEQRACLVVVHKFQLFSRSKPGRKALQGVVHLSSDHPNSA